MRLDEVRPVLEQAMRTNNRRSGCPVGGNILAVGVSVLILLLVHLSGVALAIASAAGATASSVPAQDSADSAAFQQLLHNYRTGRAQEAISALATWPVDRLAAAATAAAPKLSSSERMAAAILQAEVASALLVVVRQRKDSLIVINSGLALLRDAGRAPFGEQLGEEPKRSWYYAMASVLVASYQTSEASSLVDIGLQEFHDDPLLVTARGTISERRWDVIMFGQGNSNSDARAEALRRWQAKAIDDYKRALSLRPDLAIAKLRLGHFYLELGHEREAGPWLQSVAASTVTDNQQYLAHLLLGRIAANVHDLEASDAEYRKAYSIGAGYQAACIALSRLEAVLEHQERAAEIAEDCLRLAEHDDPWSHYRTKADPDALLHLRKLSMTLRHQGRSN
jgi:tetratricopeptide (TPR) repeat protein